jgi:hypothetical protein
VGLNFTKGEKGLLALDQHHFQHQNFDIMARHYLSEERKLCSNFDGARFKSCKAETNTVCLLFSSGGTYLLLILLSYQNLGLISFPAE